MSNSDSYSRVLSALVTEASRPVRRKPAAPRRLARDEPRLRPPAPPRL